MGPVLFLAALATAPRPVSAQGQASLGLGMGVVRYAGGSSFSALTASPAAQILSPASYLGIGGTLSLLDSSAWASQGRADVWAALSGRERGIRMALGATIAASTRSDGDAAASGSGLLEVVWIGARERGAGGVALGAGAVTGVIERVPGVGALRVRGRGWWQFTGSAAQLSMIVEGTRFLGAWYTDVGGGATLDRRRIVASLWGSGRFSRTYGSTGAASASLQYFITPSVAVEASGGTYLRDPFQGLPRAAFVAGGVRFFSSRRALRAPAAAPAQPALQPLVAARRGDTAVVRFRMPGARSVAIAGSWNAWTPAPLRGLGDDIWEATLQLAPGVYHFNLVVDGKEWVVPGGVATIPDGMGGLLALLNVL
jgi:hypothetical protein